MRGFYEEYYVVIVVAIAWTIAQITKLIYERVTQKTFDLSRVTGAGGMPSVHTTAVVALTAAIAKKDGLSSTGFAISMVLAFVVLYDAMNVRFEAGEHAKALNALFKWFENKPDAPDVDVKDTTPDTHEVNFEEKLGHTAREILVGMLIAIITVLVFPLKF
jgi:acid phosphatase family membrane protein YuiD